MAPPALVAWAGPAVLLPFVLVAIGIALPAAASRPTERLLRHMDSGWSPGLAGIATGLWLVTLLAAAQSLPVTGDEPHYLLVTQSILADGDLDLTNNYKNETYRAFYPGSLARHVTMGYLAEEYSFHGPALSVLLLPSFAWAGVPGSRLVIILTTAVGAGFFWSAARRVTGSAPAAWAGWLALASTASFALHGFLLYPDGVAAAIASFALWVLAGTVFTRTPGGVAVVALGIALATLPWFHMRLSLIAGVFGLAMIWALGRSRRDLALPFLAAPIISFVLWIASTWVMFHRLDPTAAFRQEAAGSLAQVPAGTLGLLFDAEYGLLAYAPALSLAPLGLAALRRRSPALTLVSVALIVSTLALAAAWVWWGGDSAPARLLAPVVPAIALCFAAWWAGASGDERSFAGVALALGAMVTACMATVDGGAYVLNVADGRGTLWEWLSPNVDLGLALPSLIRSGARLAEEALIAASWILTGAIAYALVTRWRGRAPRATGTSWLRASAGILAWLTVGASVALWQRSTTPWTPDRGQLRMLYAATSPELSVGVHGAGWHEGGSQARVVTHPHVTTRASAVSSLRIATPRAADTLRLHVPFVPAGRYTIEVESSTRSVPPPRLTLELGREASPFATWLAPPDATGPTFSLAVPLWSVRVVADPPDEAVSTVRLRPVAVALPPPSVGGFALRAASFGPLVVYSMDPYSVPASNGIGLVADREGTLVVADTEGRPAPFVLHLATEAAPATIALEHGAFTRSVALPPHASERIFVANEPGGLVPLRFTTSGGSWPWNGRRLGAIARVSP